MSQNPVSGPLGALVRVCNRSASEPVILVRVLRLCWPEVEINGSIPRQIRRACLLQFRVPEHGQRDSLIACTMPPSIPANTN